MTREFYIIKERVGYFDIAKGIGMILVIIGHLGVAPINHFIYSFHMPLFFFCAGYFLSQKMDIGSFIKKKARQLIIPYYFTCMILVCIVIIIDVIKGNTFDIVILDVIKWTISALYASGNREPFGIPRIGAIWFLWALFIGITIVRIMIDRLNKIFITLFAIAFLILGTYSSDIWWLPLSIQPAFCGILFVILGFYCNQIKLDFQMYKPIAFVLFVAWFCSSIYIETNMAKGVYSHGLFNYLVAIDGVYIFILLSKKIDSVLKNTKIRGILIFIGQNSLVIMCLHLLELNIIPWNKVIIYCTEIGINRLVVYLCVLSIKAIYLTLAVRFCYKSKVLKTIFMLKNYNEATSHKTTNK